MAQAQFPEPKDLEVSFEKMVGDGNSVSFQKYTISNPHPGYGKDPNILNEFGHSVYPKMIYPNGQHMPGVIVNNEEEEKEMMGEKEEAPAVQAPAANPWPTAK